MLSLPAVGEAAISISGAWDDALEQTIRDVGAVSKALTALRPGQQLGMRGPYGNGWPLDEARGRPVVVIAGGIGLAPLRGAIRCMIDHADDYPEVRLVYGARTPEDHPLRPRDARLGRPLPTSAWRSRWIALTPPGAVTSVW